MAKRQKTETEKRKDTVLFLVEGNSDKHALETHIKELFDEVDSKYNVVFALQKHIVQKNEEDNDDETIVDDMSEVDNDLDYYDNIDYEDEEDEYDFGGDITTARGIWPECIEAAISYRFFVPIINKEQIYSRKLLKVIHIVDLDGAYLPEEALVEYAPERADYEVFYYNTEAQVIEGNPERISKRNYHKRKNIDALVEKNTIHIQGKAVPYSVYFFSSNLDHVLHNEANMTKNKINAADDFSYRYEDDPNGFCDFFNTIVGDEFVGLDYQESWALIRDRKSTRSIQPHTNLHLLLNEIRNGEFPSPK